ncbi:MAG: B12-binding domain-containing radical SAM protein [Nitrospinota bacterium]
MPNTTLYHIASMTPPVVEGCATEVHTVDEYVQPDLGYLKLLGGEAGSTTLLALVGVQSHQFQRALDLAAYARKHGTQHCVMGGPHPMTCDTSDFHDRGVSFALAEAEMIWRQILMDAVRGELQPVYGADQRWAQTLDSPVITPPSKKELDRYIVRQLGVYPARGCPFLCNFCSVIKIAGRRVRSQSIETTIESLRRAQAAGVRYIMFTSDNLNKYSEVRELLGAMIEARLNLRFFCQCDAQIARQPDLVELLGRAGCNQIFVGVESFNPKTLKAARKFQNRPEQYEEIIRLCRQFGIDPHFSNIIGFPEDTEEEVLGHLQVLRELDPTVAWFYILCPCPGTEQYDDFRARGLITEQNLDRFDATCPTWQHPHLTWEQLTGLLFRCYREFYSAGHIISDLRRGNYRKNGVLAELFYIFARSLFQRFAVSKGMHPMSGGASGLRVDHVRDYLPLRREYFGCDLAPLPESLRLSPADEALNKMVNPTVHLAAPRAGREPKAETAPKLPILAGLRVPIQVPQMPSAAEAYEAAARSAARAMAAVERALGHAAEAVKHKRGGAFEKADQAVKQMLERANDMAVAAVEQAKLAASEAAEFAAQASAFAADAKERAAESARQAAERSRARAQEAAEAVARAADEIAVAFKGIGKPITSSAL